MKTHRRRPDCHEASSISVRSSPAPEADLGSIAVALTSAPADVTCVRVSYGVSPMTDFPALVATINADPLVSALVHVGDIDPAATPPFTWQRFFR
jgi:hypothetical protein